MFGRYPLSGLTAVITAFVFVFSTQASAERYDLVISNGRVMDPETGFDQVANVGITDGTIVKISAEELTGKQTVDASGHVVAPGFIDGHVHYVDMPFGVKVGLRDGLTTTLDLEAGLYDTDQWYKAKQGKSQSNYGASASLLGARLGVFNPDYVSENSVVFENVFNTCVRAGHCVSTSFCAGWFLLCLPQQWVLSQTEMTWANLDDEDSVKIDQ